MTAPAVEEVEEEEQKPSRSYGDTPTGPGKLLDEGTDDAAVCRYVHEEWSAQRDRYARRICEAEVNLRRRGGEGNLWVEKAAQDQSLYRVYGSVAGTKFNQFYQKANRLCLRMIAHLHPDPAVPEAVPMTGETEDMDAAEFATRVLKDIGSESGLNDLEAHKQAWDIASNWGSGYIRYYTDPHGGGRQPMEADAHQLAQHIDQAQPKILDPLTNQEWKGPTVTKYVRPDGFLTESPAETARRWVPKLAREVCDPGSVRLLPQTATDLWDADGLLYAKYHTWDTLVGWFPELGKVSTEDRGHAIAFRLKDCDHLLPKRGNRKHDPAPKEGHEGSGLALLMIKWCVESPDYPDGAMVVCVGDKHVPHRGTWIIESETGERERRDLPFTQVQQWRGDPDHPTGYGMMDFLGPSNENLGEIQGRVLDMLDKALNPLTLLPIGSTLQPEDLNDPFNTTVRFQPGYEPKRFEGPRIPPEAFTFIDSTKHDMDDATGLGQSSAEGVEAPNVQSGRHALAIVSQQQASLADLNQNINRAWVRGWRVQLQEIKANYTIPQLIRFVDRDGAYKAEKWKGSDLGSTRDVQVQRGTGTLFSPGQKTQFISEYATLARVDPLEVQELLATGFSPYTALEDNKHLLRVRRQLNEWEKGPPPNWQEPQPQPAVDPLSGAPMTDPMGQPMMGPPPISPELAAIFDPRPVDTAPIAAQVRIREIGQAMAGTKYGEFPQGWKMGLDMEYQRMQQALAPPPVAPPPDAKPPEQ